jgi:putative Mn2+ efflux pump MntP
MNPTVKREALTALGFGLAVLLTALWVGMGAPGLGTRGALGGLLVAGLVAAWELERLVRRWTGTGIPSPKSRRNKHREFRQWARLGALGIGLALLGALGTVSLSFPLVLILLGVVVWGLATVWHTAVSPSARSK